MSSFKSVCILRLSALGDCINAYAFALGIKRSYPNINITLVMDSRFCPLFISDKKGADIEIIDIDLKHNKLLKARSLLRDRLEGRNFDALLNIQTSIKASFLSTAIRADVKIGYNKDRSREAQCLFINKRAQKALTAHVIDGFLGFTKVLGLNVKPYFDLSLSTEEKAKALGLLNSDKKVFLISPCSAKKEKNWTLDGYFRCSAYMAQNGFITVITSGPSDYEKQFCKSLYDRLKADGCEVLNLAGATTLRELAAICSLSTVALCPDSGTMHLCNAVGTKVVGLFAIHNPDRVGPYSFMRFNVSVYQKHASQELKGAEISWRYRVKNSSAMQDIDYDDVKVMLDRAINEK